MRHVTKARLQMPAEKQKYIFIDNEEDVKGVAPIVSFAIQSDPVGEVGVNGVQAEDLIEYTLRLINSLDDSFPCKENKYTIGYLEEALRWQKERTRNRMSRNVEGKSEL